MTTPREREATPSPIIGKAGRYTVFLTPPVTPERSENPKMHSPSSSPRKAATLRTTPQKKAPPSPPPPVQVPPQQFDKPSLQSSNLVFGFFSDTVAKVQDAHSSLDEYLADWFGLNQSKYQWALNDYYGSKSMDKESGKPKEIVSKGQSV